MHGWLVIDKPLGMTSRAAVNRAQGWFSRRTPMGHTGTLDPLATGVLVLAVGVATRLTEYVQALGKVYETEFTLGATSATDDAEGPIASIADALAPDRSTIEMALQQFVGEIQQVPPAFSAAKVAGARAYKKARAGQSVELAPRMVRIDAIHLQCYAYPLLRLQILCGKGTYIRSLARDLGEALGCGGYVTDLRRTAVGDFTPAEAVSLDAEKMTTLLPLSRGVAALPRIDLDHEAIARLQHGGIVASPGPLPVDTEAAAFDSSGRLVAIMRSLPNGMVRPVKVLGQ